MNATYNIAKNFAKKIIAECQETLLGMCIKCWLAGYNYKNEDKEDGSNDR
jgi:hypothetical protein